VFRVHDVPATREALAAVAGLQGNQTASVTER
jgi:dihydropteroate synthase